MKKILILGRGLTCSLALKKTEIFKKKFEIFYGFFPNENELFNNQSLANDLSIKSFEILNSNLDKTSIRGFIWSVLSLNNLYK